MAKRTQTEKLEIKDSLTINPFPKLDLIANCIFSLKIRTSNPHLTGYIEIPLCDIVTAWYVFNQFNQHDERNTRKYGITFDNGIANSFLGFDIIFSKDTSLKSGEVCITAKDAQTFKNYGYALSLVRDGKSTTMKYVAKLFK